MGIDPVFQFPCTERQMQGMQKPDPGKGFLVRSDRRSSFLWLRFELWLRQFRDFIPEGAVIFAYLGILLVVARIDWDTQIIYDRFHILILLLEWQHCGCSRNMVWLTD